METNQTYLSKRMITNFESIFLDESDYHKNMNLLIELQDLMIELKDKDPNIKSLFKPHLKLVNDIIGSLLPKDEENIKNPFETPIIRIQERDYLKLDSTIGF